MPRPLVKRKRPKPSPITIKYVGAGTPAKTVSALEMERFAEEVKWIRETTAVSLDVWAEQERLAPFLKLKADDTVTIPPYTQEMRWFVQDVEAPERRVTAETLLFGVPFERAFPFGMVEPRPLRDPIKECEAAVALTTLKQFRARRR